MIYYLNSDKKSNLIKNIFLSFLVFFCLFLLFSHLCISSVSLSALPSHAGQAARSQAASPVRLARLVSPEEARLPLLRFTFNLELREEPCSQCSGGYGGELLRSLTAARQDVVPLHRARLSPPVNNTAAFMTIPVVVDPRVKDPSA